MARTQKTRCSICRNAWRVERLVFEESDMVLHGCTKPRKAKFSGHGRWFNQDCPDYSPEHTEDDLPEGSIVVDCTGCDA